MLKCSKCNREFNILDEKNLCWSCGLNHLKAKADLFDEAVELLNDIDICHFCSQLISSSPKASAVRRAVDSFLSKAKEIK